MFPLKTAFFPVGYPFNIFPDVENSASPTYSLTLDLVPGVRGEDCGEPPAGVDGARANGEGGQVQGELGGAAGHHRAAPGGGAGAQEEDQGGGKEQRG